MPIGIDIEKLPAASIVGPEAWLSVHFVSWILHRLGHELSIIPAGATAAATQPPTSAFAVGQSRAWT